MLNPAQEEIAMPPAATKTRAHYHYLAASLRTLEADLRWGMDGSSRIPDEWHAIAQADVPPAKGQVTMRLDLDVIAFFRSMGPGHLTRMNTVLRAFMHARLAGVVKGPEDVTYQPTPMEAYLAEAASFLEFSNRRNSRARSGKNVEDEDVVIDRRVQGLRWMEDAMKMDMDMRITERLRQAGL
jgi:hypothetical protein